MQSDDERAGGGTARLRDLFDLSGRTAIVTGGGGGLGLQMATALAEQGANLVLCARKEERCVDAAARLERDFGVRAIGLRCDVRDGDRIDAVVAETVDRFGSIDVLVNNSGATWGASVLDMPDEAWQKVMDINVTGVFRFTRSAGRVMIEQGRGSVVNVASVTAFQGARADTVDAIGYSTSKGAIVSFTRDLAVKWAPHNVRVNALAPGWFPSDMSKGTLSAVGGQLLDRIPLGRFGEPSEVKGATAFLASAASSYVTGSTLFVDGGQTVG